MVVLASQSPRRAEILAQAGIPFTVRVANADETPVPGESPAQCVARLAELKARAVAASEDEIVLGADTTVVVDGQMLGKPADAADACRMLRLLSGRRHEVLTGICLLRGGRAVTGVAVTSVWFAQLTKDDVAAYAASGEPLDKAGAYAIQGQAGRYVERIEGCYFNVVGLPIHLVYRHLRAF